MNGRPPARLLIIGLILAKGQQASVVEEALTRSFGAIEERSSDLLFSQFTGYYQPEMGLSLVRRWLAISGTVAADSLVATKLKAMNIEQLFVSETGTRRVNIDPGLLSLHNFILATTKDSSQRICINDGMFAEVTLRYRSGAFEPLDWTYPDYRCDTCLSFMMTCRRRLSGLLSDRHA